MKDSNLDTNYQLIYREILRNHRNYYFGRIFRSTIKFLVLTTLAVCGFFLVNLLFDVSIFVRSAFGIGAMIWFIIYSIVKIYPSLRQIVDPTREKIYKTAERLGRENLEIRDNLLNYLQIYHQQGTSGSEQLKQLALSQLYRQISAFPIKNYERMFALQSEMKWFIIPAVVSLCAFIFFPAATTMALKKVMIPWRNFTEPFPLTLHNESGNIQILKNESVKLVASSRGIIPDKVSLVIEQTTTANNLNTNPEKNIIELPVTPAAQYSYELSHVSSPFSYYFTAVVNKPRFYNKQAVSEKSTIEVRERPVIRTLQVKILPPAYTGLLSQLLDPNDGEITALPGSKIALNIETDKQLSKAEMIFADSTIFPMNVAGHTASFGFTAQFNTNYYIRVLDQNGIDNDKPIRYGLYLLPDEYPFAEIKQPAADVDLQGELRFPIITELRDDFGFSGVWLKGTVYRQGSADDSSNFKIRLPFDETDKGQAISEFMWNLVGFYLIPDDYINYYIEVFDNDKINGPKSFRTLSYVVRLPSLLEILTRTEEQQNDQLQEIEEMVKSSAELKKKLEEINRDLNKKQELEWEEQQEIKKQLSRHKEQMEKMSEIQKELENLVEKLDQQQVLSPETLQKYMEIQKMAQELMTPEMQEAMEKLRQAMENLDMKQVRKEMANFQFSVEQFEKNIQRFHELFKRMQLEQRMDEMAKLAELLKEEQQAVNKSLQEKEAEVAFERLKKMEENIKKNAEYLSQKIQDAQQEYQEIMESRSEKLEDAQAYMDNEKLLQGIQEMQQQLSEGQKQQAGQSGQQLQSQFEMLQSMLQMAKQQMTDQQKSEIAEAMHKTMQDMLRVSFEQESLSERSRQLNAASPQVNNIARNQARLMNNTNQLISQILEIANQTFFISPDLNQHMEEVYRNMETAINQLEERNPGKASKNQNTAMSGFNKALLSLQNSMNQMGQSKSPSGMESFMQQLQTMSGQQGQLNQESMMQFQLGQQGKMQLSPDAMARMAAQQEMIKQSLENLTQQHGSRRDVLGRLGELSGEMENVIKQLREEKMDRQLIERQEKILSRMLDAQKSVREREYSKKRKAEREDIRIVKSPPEIKKELLRKKSLLRKELMNALEEGYVPEYKEYIKNYFESLSRHNELFY